jgi:hypothetical protein
MCKYTRPIEATNISKIYDQQCPDTNDLKPLALPDGLIYMFSQMNKPQQLNGNTMPPLKIKVLACVCMYNESKNAINLTLNGIYDNLENL